MLRQSLRLDGNQIQDAYELRLDGSQNGMGETAIRARTAAASDRYLEYGRCQAPE
jgi:hypothetical protein